MHRSLGLVVCVVAAARGVVTHGVGVAVARSAPASARGVTHGLGVAGARRAGVAQMSTRVGGYWDARRETLVRDIQRRELELAELAAREAALMPMLGAASEAREQTSYAMGMAAEARANAGAAAEARIAAVVTVPEAPPAAPGLGTAGPAAVGTDGDVDGEAELVESAWEALLAEERRASAEALRAAKARHEEELQRTANFWLSKVYDAEAAARAERRAPPPPPTAADELSGLMATGGDNVPDHAEMEAADVAPRNAQGVSTVSAAAVETLEAELFALEADYEAISDQCEVMRETLSLASERLSATQAELDAEQMASEIKVQKVLAFMLAKAKADAAAAAAAAEARREEDVQKVGAFWIASVEALKEELAVLKRK